MTLRLTIRLTATAALIIAAAAIAGCSKGDNETLAEVGKDKITVREFKDYTTNLNYTWPNAQAEFDTKREALDSLIVGKLLIQAAYEKGLDKSEEVARVVEANRNKFLLDALYQKHVTDKVKVTDAELREYWDKLQYKLRASQIQITDPDSAQMVFKRAKAGENFEQLAYDYSVTPSAKRDRGDIGYFVWGAYGLPDEILEAAFQMEPGQISPPVKTQYGYHVIKLTDKLPNESRRDFDSMKEEIRRQIETRKRTQLARQFIDEMKQKYPFTIDSSTCDYVMFKRKQLYPPQLLSNMPRSDFDVEQLDRNERELVLATWEGGQMTLYEYLLAAARFPPNVKPDLDDYDSLRFVVQEMKMPEVLAYEANKEGIENSDDFKRKMKLFRELSMADLMRNDSISTPVQVNDAMARRYYESHLQDFTKPRQIYLYEILTSDELLANRLAKELKTLDAFKKAAAKYTERPSHRGSNGDLGFIQEKWFPNIFPEAWKLGVGQIGGPVPTQGKYSVFYVADKKAAEQQDFLEVKRTIVGLIQSEKKQEAFAQWVKEREAEYPINVHEDVLWKLIDSSRYVGLSPADTTG